MDEHLFDKIECEGNLIEVDFVISDEWLDEIHRRTTDIDAGSMEMIPVAEVFASIRRCL